MWKLRGYIAGRVGKGVAAAKKEKRVSEGGRFAVAGGGGRLTRCATLGQRIDSRGTGSKKGTGRGGSNCRRKFGFPEAKEVKKAEM